MGIAIDFPWQGGQYIDNTMTRREISFINAQHCAALFKKNLERVGHEGEPQRVLSGAVNAGIKKMLII